MKWIKVSVGLLLIVSVMFGQIPSTQLKIKEKSGFLGMGGPRIVQIQLSTNQPATQLNSDNVNSGEYYYFFVTPAGDWKLDEDFIKENLLKVTIYQDGQTFPIQWNSNLIATGNGGVILGFSKDVKLYKLMLFQCPMGETINQSEMSVPQEYWPGFSFLQWNLQQADQYVQNQEFRKALWHLDQIVSNNMMKIFPQYDSSKLVRVATFEKMHNYVINSFENIFKEEGTVNLKATIGQIDSFKPILQYILDSLARPMWGISSLDGTVAPLLLRARETMLRIGTVRDSLQQVLDEETIRWLMTSSSTGKNGFLYQYMIETLTYAFASLPFEDTTMTTLVVRIPEEMMQRLQKNNLTETYETFLRVCNERLGMRLPLFPVEFLPNLKKDSTSFSLPYYSMLKAVNDYYSSNWNEAQNEILKIFKTSYDTDLNARFDLLRVVILNRSSSLTPEITGLLREAQQAEAKKDVSAATELYRQLTIVAPTFAYGYFLFGRFYSRTGDVNRAIFYYQRAYQIDSLYLTAYRECYNSYLKLGNYKPMIEVMTTALAKGANFWEIHFNLGMAYMGDGDIAKAIQHYEQALALNPRSYKANLQLGLAYQNAKNYQKAREFFNNAIGIDPTRQEAVDYLTKLNELQRMGK